MKRCIQLAENGLGTTYPNPLVGSVIVYNNTVIGEGWHRQAGEAHAEVNAIMSVKDHTLLNKATLYVNLEPCSHHGKTPPCSNLIIEKGIKNVVIGSVDPNPKVAGKGIEKLQEAGCNVTTAILKEECDYLNRRFFTYHQQKRPYIVFKWAQTKDGFIAPNMDQGSLNISERAPVWISNSHSKQRVHQMRSEEQAILVGTQTVLSDNPSLTLRDWQGDHPLRVIIDRSLKISKKASVLDGTVPTLIITEKEIENSKNCRYETARFSENIPNQICAILYRYHVQSLIVEGGSKTIQSFIDSNLWDEAFVFIGETTFGEGVAAPTLASEVVREEHIENDILQLYKNEKT